MDAVYRGHIAMEKSVEQEIVENNTSITRLLKRNEELFQKALDKSTTVSVRNEDRIRIPSGFIGTRYLFVEEGRLKDLVPDQTTRSNIAYAMQLSDFYRYALNRFYIWGSVKTMLCKSAIINLVAIMEALILESANCINDYCKQCPRIDKCKSNITKYDRYSMKTALRKLCELKLLPISKEDEAFLNELFGYRDRIHIRLSENNEFTNDIFNRSLHNKAAKYVKQVCDLLYENALPFYDSCIEHRENVEAVIRSKRDNHFSDLHL